MKMRLRFLRYIPLLLLVVLGVALMTPSPIDAVAWSPEPVPAWSGALTPNSALLEANLLATGQLYHPEDMAFDSVGRIYTGTEDGTIYRLTLDNQGALLKLEPFAVVGGFPLGLRFDQTGRLIAAVKEVGLLAIDPKGQVELLTATANGSPITYANSLDITRTGLIYFTDSSVKFDRGFPYDVLEGQPHGRLLLYDPSTRETRVIRDGFYFANGVVLATDERYLLVNETARYRIARYWLEGEQAGTWDYFAENLPLLPDNISRDPLGNFWLGGGRRMAMIDKLQPQAFLKKQVAKIPLRILRAFPALPMNHYGLVLVLDETGSIRQSLHDPTGRIYAISSARVYEGYLYLGTLLGNGIARYPYNP
jgi:sugar lactone lactonase YvrE